LHLQPCLPPFPQCLAQHLPTRRTTAVPHYANTANLLCRLVALIELAEGPLSCATMVACVERSIPDVEAAALTRGLQWAGFSMTTLEHWASGRLTETVDLTSPRWLFMGMEV
jgi:hypothetical protein